MCWKLHCPFKTRGSADEEYVPDEITNLLIFGVSGMTGGAFMDAILGCAWFNVRGFTRSKQGRVHDELVAKGVRVFTGDMNKPKTISKAMKDVDTVFLVTNYWDSKSFDTEYDQGVNVVNAAIENSVKHLIYVGTDFSIEKAKETCYYLQGKAMVENYIVSVGIPFTILHLGFYYENLLSVFKPHRTGNNTFVIALPMGEKALNCGSVYDFGCCIGKLALMPQHYLFRTVKIATDYMTVSDIVEKLNNHFSAYKFNNPRISLDDYRRLDLPEAKELTSMFTHYMTVPEWDRSIAYHLYPTWRTFNEWLCDNEKDFIHTMTIKPSPDKMLEGLVHQASNENGVNIAELQSKIPTWLPLLGSTFLGGSVLIEVPPPVSEQMMAQAEGISNLKAALAKTAAESNDKDSK